MRWNDVAVCLCAVLFLTVDAGSEPLRGRHQVSLNLGMWNQVSGTRTEISLASVETSAASNGLFGGVSYRYWLQEGLALSISVGGMAVDVTTRSGIEGTISETSVVSPILMGIKYYFPASTYTSNIRPYAGIAAGPYIGNQEKTESQGVTVLVESRTEGAVGGRLSLGADFILSRHFSTGFSLGYNLMTDFDRPIGGSRNFSGPQLASAFSYPFGDSKD